MEKLGVDMEYYGGFGAMALHGSQMRGAARIAKGWAQGIKASTPAPPRRKKA